VATSFNKKENCDHLDTTDVNVIVKRVRWGCGLFFFYYLNKNLWGTHLFFFPFDKVHTPFYTITKHKSNLFFTKIINQSYLKLYTPLQPIANFIQTKINYQRWTNPTQLLIMWDTIIHIHMTFNEWRNKSSELNSSFLFSLIICILTVKGFVIVQD